MTQVSAKLWAALGWISVLLVAASIPIAMVDGVIGVLALYSAIVIGGFSGVGTNSTAKFGVSAIVLSLLIANVMTHYTASTGLRSLQSDLLFSVLVIFALPMLVATAFLIVGVIRRRYAGDRRLES